MLIVTLAVVAVIVLVLFLVLFKRVAALSIKTKAAVFISLLAASLLTNTALLGRYLVLERSVGGAGQFQVSPDGSYVARASSHRSLLKTQPTYYLLTIESKAGKPLKSIRIDTGETNDPYYFRRLPQIIQWSTDSKEVTFSIPGIWIRMDHKLHSEDELGRSG